MLCQSEETFGVKLSKVCLGVEESGNSKNIFISPCSWKKNLQGIQFCVYAYFHSTLWKYYPCTLGFHCCYGKDSYKSNGQSCLPFLWAVFKIFFLCLGLYFFIIFWDVNIFLLFSWFVVLHKSDGPSFLLVLEISQPFLYFLSFIFSVILLQVDYNYPWLNNGDAFWEKHH